MDLQEVGRGFMDWFEMAQDTNRWRALVNAVMKVWVPKMRGISLLVENQLASQGLCSMK
jgi:hypothetical protein